MLYTVKIDPNKSFLRALMTAFYASSHKARDLLAFNLTDEREQGYLSKAWDVAKPFQNLPMTQKTIDEIDARAAGYFNAMRKDTRARFFAHLVEFVRHVKQVADRENQGEFRDYRLSSDFTFQPSNESLGKSLKSDVRQHFAKIIQDLRNEELRGIILKDYTPDALDELTRAEAAKAASIKAHPFKLDFMSSPLSATALPEDIVYDPAENKPSPGTPNSVHLH